MPTDLMRYDVMAREALRGVVKAAFKRVAREGDLPGEHHFYVTFATHAPGVDIDPELLDSYPKEMTIVLEHQFWELQADDEAFEVTLKFGGVPKYLRIPYTAVTRFHDPSVGFALQFSPEEAGMAGQKISAEARIAEPADETGASDSDAPADASADVVSLDAFRRK